MQRLRASDFMDGFTNEVWQPAMPGSAAGAPSFDLWLAIINLRENTIDGTPVCYNRTGVTGARLHNCAFVCARAVVCTRCARSGRDQSPPSTHCKEAVCASTHCGRKPA